MVACQGPKSSSCWARPTSSIDVFSLPSKFSFAISLTMGASRAKFLACPAAGTTHKAYELVARGFGPGQTVAVIIGMQANAAHFVNLVTSPKIFLPIGKHWVD